MLEALHLADSATLDLLMFLMGKSQNIPLTFILVARPQEGPMAERLHSMATQVEGRVTHITLEALGQAEMELLISNWFAPGRDEAQPLPPELSQHLLTQAAGNPFFLEELLAMWVAHDALIKRGGRWSVRADLEPDQMTVPASLNALLTARLDHLPERARRTLQLASVIGLTFPLNLLKHVAQQHSHSLNLSETLPLLAEQGLVERQEAEGGEQWAFRHPLVRETIYQELLHREQRELHALVGSSLELLFPKVGPTTDAQGESSSQAASRAELIAYHFEQAEEWKRALPYLLRAAEAAAARFDTAGVLRYGQRALKMSEHAEAAPDTQLRLNEPARRCLSL